MASEEIDPRPHKYMTAMDSASGHHLKGGSAVKSLLGLHYSIKQ